jgi:hypothetical protein
VNLALPLNAIPDSNRPDLAGFDIQRLAAGALQSAIAGSLTKVVPANKA